MDLEEAKEYGCLLLLFPAVLAMLGSCVLTLWAVLYVGRYMLTGSS